MCIVRVQTADHLAYSGVGTGTMAMRTTSSMPPWLPTTIVSTEPAAVVGMGAPAQTQSGYYLPASLLLRVLSSQAHRSLRSPCNCRSVSAAMHVRACMRVWLGRYVHSCERTQVCMSCVTACLCVRVRPCAEHARVSTRAYVRDVVLSACVSACVM
jgi:hypothetical protein